MSQEILSTRRDTPRMLSRHNREVHLPRRLSGVLGMRWWLGLAFAGVAALTAVAVVWVLNTRSVHAFHDYAESLAVGRSLVAVEALKHDTTIAAVRRDAVAVSRE